MNIAFAVVKHPALGGGIERYTEELGARLVRRGHGVRVYTMRLYGPLVSPYRGMQVCGVPSIPGKSAEKLSAATVSVAHAAFSSWADIVHLHSVAPGALGWLCRLRRKPAILQLHGIEWQRARWSRFGSNVLKTLERASVRCNRHLTAVSRTQCDHIRATYGADIRHIPGGAEAKPAPAPREILALGLEPGRFILFASRLVREKGAHDLVTAFRRLETDDKLVIAGDAPGHDAYKQELRDLAAGDPRIVWPGFVQGRLLDELFAHARIYVHPSSLEGLSLALLEAMQFGTCCLASDIPENLEAIGDGGLAFRQGDVSDLAAKLTWLREHPDEAVRLGAKASARCHTLYSWDRITDAFELFYHEASQRVPGA